MPSFFELVYTPTTPQRPAAPEGAGGRASGVDGALAAASAATGVSFDYLLQTATRESALDPDAQARTSSATGLFQFIESTWLETMKEAGPALGLADVADDIERTATGRYVVADPETRADVLALRRDPEIAALLAGALTVRNADYLAARLGRTPDAGELYIAHFLGAGGAAALIERATATPDSRAADLFPRQAAANRGIFYERDGSARSLSEVYANLVARHEGGPVTATVAPAMAFAEQDAAHPDDAFAEQDAADADDPFAGLFSVAPERSAPSRTGFFNTFLSTPAVLAIAEAASPPTAAASGVSPPTPRAGPLDLGSYQRPAADSSW